MDLIFSNPAFLWALGLAALPILIHLIQRRRARRLYFAAIEFVLRSRQRMARWLRLKQILLLALRTAIVAALALAFARPLRKPREAQAAVPQGPAATAFVLDGSLSMRYRLGGEALFERARALVRAAIESLPASSPASFLLCDGTPRAPTALSFDRSEPLRAVREAADSYRHADLNACIGAAARALGESPIPARRVVAASDLTLASLDLSAPPPTAPAPPGGPPGDTPVTVAYLDAADGADLPNAAVTAVEVSPSAELGPRGYAVAATILNASPRGLSGLAVSLRVNGAVVTRGFVDLPPGGVARKEMRHRFEPGPAEAEVEIAPAESGLAEDDRRAFVLTVPREVRVLVVDGAPNAIKWRDEAFFMEAAFSPHAAQGRFAARFVDPDGAQAEALTAFDVVFLLNVPAPAPAFAQALKGFVAGGGGLFISAGDQVDPDLYNESLGDLLPRTMRLVKTQENPPARFARADWAHPALAVFDAEARAGLESSIAARYVLLEPDPRGGSRVLAHFDDGSPSLVEGRRGQGRVVLYTSSVDRDWSDWPIRSSFLPAVQQIAGWLSRSLEEPPATPALVGQPVTPRLPEGARAERAEGPGGARLLPGPDGAFIPEAPGVYRVRLASSGTGLARDAVAFAANTDPRESDTARARPEEVPGGAALSPSAAANGGGRPFWSALLLAMVVAFALEGLLLRK